MGDGISSDSGEDEDNDDSDNDEDDDDSDNDDADTKSIPTERPKFNYEKYIKFLELTLETVGFSLARVTLTWDRVSFFLALLASLVGVFGQSAVLRFKSVDAS